MNRLHPSDAADPRAELVQMLSFNGIPFQDHPDEIRFVLYDRGCQWETLCHFASQTVLFYSIYPFPVQQREQALIRLNEINAQLQRGGLFLSGDRMVLRISAVLADVYTAQEVLTRALEYSAGVMKHFWDRMAGCTYQMMDSM